MSQLFRDLQFAVRHGLRRPGLTMAILVSLLLGVGLNTAVFTLLDSLFLRPWPVDDTSTLVVVHGTRRAESGEFVGHNRHSFPDFRDFRQRQRSLEDLAAYHWWPMNLGGGDEPVRATGMFVSPNYFEVLGLEPTLGRFFHADEGVPGAGDVVVLSDGCWRRTFGGDPGVRGRSVQVNGRAMTVVGVAPPGFVGTELPVSVDFFVPSSAFVDSSPYGGYFETRGISLWSVVGRLREDVPPPKATADLMAIARQIESEFPKEGEGLGVRLEPLVQANFRPADRQRFLGYGEGLVVASGLVLLICCVNVSSLLLGQALGRRREMAIRRALGAGHGALWIQWLVEILLLFTVAAVLALPLARWVLDLLWRLRPPQFAPDLLTLTLNTRVFGFTLLVALGAALLFGLWPGWRAVRGGGVLGMGGGRATGRPRRRWVDPLRWVVVGQVALATLTVVAAMQMLQTYDASRQQPLGFDAADLLTVGFAPGELGWSEERTRGFYDRVLEEVGALPGVGGVALSENRLLRGAVWQQQLFFEGDEEAATFGGRAYHRTNVVAPGFFETVGIPLLRGRDFDPLLGAEGPPAVIVNRTLAEAAWPGRDPIGQRLRFDYPDTPLHEVVGVVEDASYRHVREAPQFFLYLPLSQRFRGAMTLHVRGTSVSDPNALLKPVRETVQGLAPDLPLADVRPLSAFVADDLWFDRVTAWLLATFAALALALSGLGIYGILARSVAGRRREFGIRLALGARLGHLGRTLFGEAAALLGAGLVVGLALVWGATRTLPSLADALGASVWGQVLPWIVLPGLVACGLPLWRTARLRPADALREDS